jgi:hypothetical protein
LVEGFSPDKSENSFVLVFGTYDENVQQATSTGKLEKQKFSKKLNKM